jgi:hypothetical protein
MFFDVRAERNEMLFDEAGDGFVGVRFGFQPNAAASGGCGAEIDEQRLVRALRFRERRIDVFSEFRCHRHTSIASSDGQTSR